MGSESSKLEAPDEFGQSGNQFQIISPVSDISCPSDIHRINRLRSQQRKAHPSDPSRRISRTVTKTLQNQPKHQPSAKNNGLPPPSHFYFPTKDTEKAFERVERRSQQSEKENERPKIFNKTKKILQKTQKAMTGCFAEDHAERMEAEQRLEETKHHPTLGIARKVLPKKGYHVSEYDAMLSYKSMDDPSLTPEVRRFAEPTKSTASAVESVTKRESDYHALFESSSKIESFDAAQAALHQADDYFTRLAGGSPEPSPYVNNKAGENIPSALGRDESESPVSRLFGESNDSKSVLSKTVDSIIESSLAESDVERKRHSISPSTQQSKHNSATGYLSPSSSILEYQQAIGTIAETPGYYPDGDDEDSDPVFSDDALDDFPVHRQATRIAKSTTLASHDQSMVCSEDNIVSKLSSELTTITEKADDESSVMSGLKANNNTNSAFRPLPSIQSNSIQQTATALASYHPSIRNVSKLESLFRPVLPSLSADDAQTTSSYDPWEIKVTESAPSVMEKADYRSMATRLQSESPQEVHLTALEKKIRGGSSPSMMSIDSQVDTSPGMTKDTVSEQASYNADFLFKTQETKLMLKAPSDTESDMSINTSGARSRLSNRTGTKAVAIQQKHRLCGDDQSQYSRESDPQSRFSLLDAVSGSVGLAPKESIDVPTIESKLSDLTDMGRRSSEKSDTTPDHAKDRSSLETVPLTALSSSNIKEKNERPKAFGQWSYNNDGVTPFRKGMEMTDATSSPYLRFQSAKTRFESQAAVVEIPEIQNKVSDLTDDAGGKMGYSSVDSDKAVPDTVHEEPETKTETPDSTSDASQMQVRWSYSVMDGDITAVTPYFGKDTKNATKSPYIRFANAKNKFSGKHSQPPAEDTALKSNALVKKENAFVEKGTGLTKKETSLVKKEVPFRSPRSSRAKQSIRRNRQLKSGGSVASKVQELNQRVVEAKIDRKKHRWTKSNPRKYGINDSNAVRTRAIVQYKTDVVGLDRINYMSAAKFNTIPIDDDSSVESSLADGHSKKLVTFAEPRPLLTVTSSEQNEADDEYDDSDDWSKLTTDTSSVATIRREKPMPTNGSDSIRVSEGTYSTASSGLTNVKKRVFRGSSSTRSSSRHSLSSDGESTTMSSILNKENSNYLPFRASAKTVKPTQQTLVTKPDLKLSTNQHTPMQAQKWRNLAAAAHLRDSQKKANRKGLAVKSANILPLASYEC